MILIVPVFMKGYLSNFMKKRPLSRILFFLLLLLFLVLFAFLGIRTFYHAAYTPETCTETVEELSNPYIGFYHMYGYVPGSDTLSNLPPMIILIWKKRRVLSCWN